jgi:oxygen-independent coproporphyrinogen III oxidase
MSESLIKKYNVAGPRYTSYPTVPFWEDNIDQDIWESHIKKAYRKNGSISLYIHLPYCESLCTYCGCNKRITRNHGVEEPYIETLLKEWAIYAQIIGERPKISTIHLGGGTPTFFSPENLSDLIQRINTIGEILPEAEMSFEAHPNSTNKNHLETLYNHGFRRLSLGIQDFDLTVQKIVNRVQPFEVVERVVKEAREIGYTSINFDLIYGLPMQKTQSIRYTFELVNKLRPERIAYYSYAHVPWVSPGQRSYTDKDLPTPEQKLELYLEGKKQLTVSGYHEIGMDHFSLPKDDLYLASQEERLHRNFMGYTTDNSELSIGLGVSAIGDTFTAFAQNLKVVEEYQDAVNQGVLPILRGHELHEEDLSVRRIILNIMCHMHTSWEDSQVSFDDVYERLEEMIADGLVEISENDLRVTPKGRPFLRNVCMAFDKRLLRSEPTTNLFSATI